MLYFPSMRRRGFTLIELLIVIGVIGLLATLSIASFSTSKEKARIAAGQLVSKTILDAVGDDAIGSWNFDECGGSTAFDASGTSHNGTLVGTPGWAPITPTNNGCSLAFDGSSDYISTSYNWTAAHNNFTVSAWFKTTSTGDEVIVSNGNTHAIRTNSGRAGSCLASCVLGTGRIDDGKWHFIAVTGDNTSIRVYLDALSKPYAIMAASSNVSVGQMSIGHCSFGGYNFNGYIDDVRIYQRALTVRELRKQYAVGLDKIAER